MKIAGNLIADQICADLKLRVGELEKRGIKPRLAVILVGNDPSSEAYVFQKSKKINEINAEIEVSKFPEQTSAQTILEKIHELNTNHNIHGIIVQRPLPYHIDPELVTNAVIDEKDVDGFKAGSPFNAPIVLAVMRILEEEYKQANKNNPSLTDDSFLKLLKRRHIVVVGKGSTAGGPIMEYFKEKGINFQVIDSKTENPQDMLKEADIIISSVGKGNIIMPESLKKGVVLLGIGIFRGKDGKLQGDYDEAKIEKIASYYTPTPGGVGPVNASMLLQNLILAAEKFNR